MNKVLLLASMFHPQHKSLKYLTSHGTNLLYPYGQELFITQDAWKVFLKLVQGQPQPTEDEVPSDDETSSPPKKRLKFQYSEQDSISLFGNTPEESRQEAVSSVESEVERWQNFRDYDKVNPAIDILAFWADHEGQFPHIARAAKGFLCVPATSASSERVWSMVRRIFNFDRSNIAPENLSAVLYLKQTMLNAKGVIDDEEQVQEYLEDD